jgi:hypothetical protein
MRTKIGQQPHFSLTKETALKRVERGNLPMGSALGSAPGHPLFVEVA